MYRMLIVDDEDIITDGLYETFSQWRPDQLDICKAYSAAEALGWMARTRIDIVLTDIRMPGMSGMELTEHIRAHWPRCRVVFLTGYSEFDYAYKAIQMPHVRYLLKTEGYAKVMETVGEVMQELDHGKQMAQMLEQSQEQSAALELVAQADYLRRLIQPADVAVFGQERLSRSFGKLNISLNAGSPVVLVLGRIESPEGSYDSEEAGESIRAVRLIWDSFIGAKLRSLGSTDRQGDPVWFVQPAPGPQPSFDRQLILFLEGTLELIQEACLESLGASVSFTFNGNPCDWSGLPDRYARLRRLQQMKIGGGLSVILKDGEGHADGCTGKDGMALGVKTDHLKAHLEAGREEDFMMELDRLSYFLVHSEGNQVWTATEGYYSVALVLLSYMNRLGLHGKTGDAAKLMRLDDHASMKDAFGYLKQTAATVFQFRRMDERDRTANAIDRICQFIEDHLHEDLSLVRLAEAHYFNPSYLSRLFKQERGINLSEYIDQCRMRRAKELLKDGDLKVRDVAVMVGYEAAHSFTRFFKKVTGMTPQEYRDSLAG